MFRNNVFLRLPLVVLMLGATAYLPADTLLIEPLEKGVVPGETIQLQAHFSNLSADQSGTLIPTEIQGNWINPQTGESFPFNAVAETNLPAEALQPFATFSGVYSLAVPAADASGLILQADNPYAPPIPVKLTTEPLVDDGLWGSQPQEPTELNPKTGEVLQRYQENFSVNEPIYFSVGWRGRTNAKFQFSFKYRVFNEEAPLNQILPVFDDLYLTYTQTSIWDLESDSAPFFDSSYKPGFFYFHNALLEELPWKGQIGLQTGFEHESNGKDGADSRSINIAYIWPQFHFGELDKYHLTIAPKIYTYVGDLSDNPDIDDYRGYVDLHVKFGHPESWQIAGMFRKGMEDSFGSIQVDLSYPIHRILYNNVDTYLHLQYFNGWGESLRAYDSKLKSQFRVGVMLLR